MEDSGGWNPGVTNFPINPQYDKIFEMSDKPPSMSKIEKEPEIWLLIKYKPNVKNQKNHKKTNQSLNLENKEEIIP